MITKAVAPSIMKEIGLLLPSVSQFSSGVFSKCVAFGISCAVTDVSSVASSTTVDAAPENSVSNNANRHNLMMIRGGSDSMVDMERVGFRLSSIGQYAIVSSILLGALIEMYGDIKIDDETLRSHKLVYALYSVFVTVAINSALYTTVIFSLLSLYENTALGLGADKGFIEFVNETANIRKMGFQSFLLCLMSFQASFTCNIFLKFKGRVRIAVVWAMLFW
jgi:hypothetical protein